MTSIDEAAREPDSREQLQRGLAFLRRAARFWHVPLLALLVGGVAFAIFNLIRKPEYRSETVILYIERAGSGTTESSQAERSASARLRELLMSRPRLERMVTAFDLYSDVKRRYGMGDAIEELKKHVDFRAPGGDTFSIAFTGGSPSEAQRVTAELARSVIEGDAQLRKHQAKVALDFLASEKKSSETQLRDAEQKLAAFMAAHPRFALDTTPLANGAAIRASMGATPAVAQPGGQPRVIWTPPPAAAPGPAAKKLASESGQAVAAAPAPAMVANHAEEARARAALAAARENLTEQLSRYTPAHPDVRAAEAAVARATERLAALASGAPAVAAAPASPAQTPAPAASAAPRPRTAAPPAPVAVSAPRAAARDENLVDLETEWLQLTRAVTEARQRQDQIEAQLFRADIQAGSAAVGHGVHVSIIDPAYLPERPQPPGRTTIAVIFAAVSLALGTLLTLILAALDERMFLPRDAEGVATILAEVPSPSPRRAHVAA
jgi:capsular polysaccharide biosynthesis protein